MIGQADGYISAAIHAPTSGVVSAVDQRPVPHPSGLPDWCVSHRQSMARSAGSTGNRSITGTCIPVTCEMWCAMPASSGLGGAVFPSAVKLNLSGHCERLEHLILNGAECEPWMTCDDRLMRERAAEIVAGIHIMAHLLAPREVLIGIEDDKPEAIAAMTAACAGTGYEVRPVPTRYPSGSVKQLVKLLTGKEAPTDGRRSTCRRAVFQRRHRLHAPSRHPFWRAGDFPHRHRHRPCRNRSNLEVLLGTPFAELITESGGYQDGVERLIMGGPMMGFALHSDGYR
jgi:electron transport complex protein RnfC